MEAFKEFEKAVLLEKGLILNGILANGTPTEKAKARKEWEALLLQLNANQITEDERPFL